MCATENTKVENCWQDMTLESRETLDLLQNKKLWRTQFLPFCIPPDVIWRSSQQRRKLIRQGVRTLRIVAELFTCFRRAFDNAQAQSSTTTDWKGANSHPGTSDTNIS